MAFKPLFAACALACAATLAQAAEPLTTVPALDVPRYMGTWYEIAKFPNWFQRKCLDLPVCFSRQAGPENA